jgi:hypothetical protein
MASILGDSEHQVHKTNSYIQWSQLYVYCLHLRLLAMLYMFFEMLTSVCQFAPKLPPGSFPGSCNLISLPQSIPQFIRLYSRIDG